MKKANKHYIRKYLLTLRYILFPPRKKYILLSKRNKINAGGYTIYNLEINNSIKIKEKVKYFHTPKRLYKSIRTMITESSYIYLIRNQKGFNSYFFNRKFDIMITDHRGKIIDLIEEFKIDQISKYYKSAYYIYFLPLGSITYYNININDLANFKRLF